MVSPIKTRSATARTALPTTSTTSSSISSRPTATTSRIFNMLPPKSPSALQLDDDSLLDAPTKPAAASGSFATSSSWLRGSVLGSLFLAVMVVLVSLATSVAAQAADFAGQDISGQDFSGQDLSHQDFTGVVAQQTNFRKANLEGAVFRKANLVRADFTGANLRGANLVDAVLDGTDWRDVTAERAVFSATILDIGNLENADLTDSLWPSKLRIMICDMDDIIKGTNPKTGVETFDSLLCSDYNRKS